MKKIWIAATVLAAMVGIGGAYASHQHSHRKNESQIYNWYTNGGTFQFTGTFEEAVNVCPGGFAVCLRGTAILAGIHPTYVYKP